MTPSRTAQVPHLLVLRPRDGAPRRVDLVRDRVVVGRDPACDLRFDSPHVSRRHAALVTRGGRTCVQDLGSSAGTCVNGVPVDGERELRPGDVLDLADVQVRFEADGTSGDPTVLSAVPLARLRVPEQSSNRFDVHAQTAGRDVNNVGRDQFIAHVQQRDAFLRDIAATRTRARWLVVLGFLVFASGFALFASGVLSFIGEVTALTGASDSTGPLPEPGSVTPFGEELLGLPRGLWGWVMAAGGALLMIVGLVLHVVAAARRRRVDRDLPLPGQGG